MKQIVDLLNNQTHQPLTTSSKGHSGNVSYVALELADKVFAELAIIYGSAWKSQHSTHEMWEVARRKWANSLSGLKPEEIRYALDQCIKADQPDYPISLKRFMGLALSSPTTQQKRREKEEKERKEKLDHGIGFFSINTRGYQEFKKFKDEFLRRYPEPKNERVMPGK